MRDIPSFNTAPVATRVAGDASGHPTITDWKDFMNKYIIPTYHLQPMVAVKLVPPTPITFDGRTLAEIPTFDDIGGPKYGMTPKHSDTKIGGDPVTVPLPQISITTLLTDDEMAMPFAGRKRLKRWVTQATQKIAEKEDIIAFQGSTALGVVGFIGADSTDLGAPTGVWDVDTGSNGILDNAWADFRKSTSTFTSAGLGKRAIHFVITSYMYNLLSSTLVLYSTITNLDLIFKALPKGSSIDYTDNICPAPSATAATNKMVALVQLINGDEGGYQIFSSGIQQKIHKTDLWEQRYGLREKYSVKVVNSVYVHFMDEIDVKT